jgi:FdhD protein
MNDVDLSGCMLFTSGRIPTDMAVKAIRAGIPILATKTVATDKAVELARTYRLTLICEATPLSFDILNDGMNN